MGSDWQKIAFRLGIAAAIALALVAMTLATDRLMRERAVAEQGKLAHNDAAILASSLKSELDKFSLVPLVLADDPQARAMLKGSAGEKPGLNLRLEELAERSSASAIYITDAKGNTLVSSNWREPTSFVGNNYSFRRYFKQALANGSATQFALGTVSREPGLYIAQRVGPRDHPLGMVAVKVEFDRIEENWRNTTAGVYVANARGIVLLATREDWRFKAVDAAALKGRDRAADLQQFGIRKLELLSVGGNSPDIPASAPMLDTKQLLLPSGWVLHLLADPSPQINAAVANGRLALLLGAILLAALLAGGLFLRRRRVLAAEAELALRTDMLREQLSQANRLATLGQVAAGVGHEISQPVAATRVFAENAQRLLAAGDEAAAAGNMARIVELTERIGNITGELRRFSRRQPGERRAMPVGEAVEGALLLLHDRILHAGTEIVTPPEELSAVQVKAEHVRLEQVLVNLLQNALDAIGTGGWIALAIELQPDLVVLKVRDSGPGVTKEQAETLFHPFSTSKPEGLGLGLVISREIMRELGGDLTLEDAPSGACFTMTIPRA